MALTAISMIILCLFALSSLPPLSSSRSDAEVREMYVQWTATHGRAYNGLGEEERRFEIFKENLRFVDEHNAVQNRTYKLGMNRFTDMTNEEYRRDMLGTRSDAKRRFMKAKIASRRYAPSAGDRLPKTIDWRVTALLIPSRI